MSGRRRGAIGVWEGLSIDQRAGAIRFARVGLAGNLNYPPSAVLRAPEEKRPIEYQRLVEDLKKVREAETLASRRVIFGVLKKFFVFKYQNQKEVL